VLGLGPIGDMAARIARHRGAGTVIGVDLVPERLQRARERGADVIDISGDVDLVAAVQELTGGRGPDAVIDAVGMEAHGSPGAKAAHTMVRFLPDSLAERLMTRAGVDRLAALHTAIDLVRRGGTISIVGVYGGMTDPLPMMTMFDKQIAIRMGQANVRRWVDDILPLLTGEDDPLGVDSFATHRLPLSEAPDAYATFQAKRDGAVKILFAP
jgi:threonine dehydrogenase-like Zn-dependent dehydrogenase